MATNTWSAAANGVWSADGNWSLGHAPLAAEDIVFDITSVKNCTVDVSPSVTSLTISVAYTGVWDMTGQTMTIAGNMSDHGITGVHTYGNGFIFNGASAAVEFHPGNAAAVCTNAILTFNGTTAPTLAINSAMSTNPFKQIVLGANALCTVSGTNFYIKGTGPLISTGAGTTFTANTTIYLTVTAASDLWSIGGTFNGTGAYYNKIGASTITVNVPAPAYAGSGILDFGFDTAARTNSTWLWTGNMSWGSGTVQLSGSGAGTIVDFNNYNVTTTSTTGIMIGTTNTTLAVFMRSGTFTAPGVFRVYDYAGNTVNFNDSIVNLSSAAGIGSDYLTFGTLVTVNADNGIITLTPTGSGASITSGGKALPTIRINASGKVVTLAGNLICTNLIVYAGTLNYNGKTLTTTIKNVSQSVNVPLSPVTVSTCINLQPCPLVSMR